MKQLKITPRYTNRDSVSLESYLKEIRNIEMLSPDEEVELARKIREGDKEALHKLVNANLRFVVSVAKQYQSDNLSLSDLINEGNVGLIRAAEKFDETMGFKFISYAVWWIRQSILQSIVENSRLVRLPLNKAHLYNKLTAAYQDFLQEFERPPTNAELAEQFELTVSEVEEIIANGPRHVSLDAPLGEESDGSTLIDLYEGEDNPKPDVDLMAESLKQEIYNEMQFLSAREIEVLENFYGLNGKEAISLEEIGSRMNLTRERVRQIKELALRRLRHKVNSSKLLSYLG